MISMAKNIIILMSMLLLLSCMCMGCNKNIEKAKEHAQKVVFSYQRKRYFVVVKDRVENHFTRLTQVLVAKDGTYVGEGAYYNGTAEFYE